MNTGLLITILVIVVIVVLVAVLLGQRRRTQQLQQQFGPEYQRTMARTGDQRSAEADLSARQQRRRQLNIVALDPAARDRYLEAWRAADVSVDHPQWPRTTAPPTPSTRPMSRDWPAPTTCGRRSCTTGRCSPSCWTSKATACSGDVTAGRPALL